MHFNSVVLFLSATISASAYPGTLPVRRATGAPKSANFACTHGGALVGQQLEEMSRLRGFNITIPPYLAGYYTAIDDGLEEIGCPGHVSLGRRESTALRLPCDVVNEQHERMMLLVNGFEANNIGIAPFIAGFLSATLDGNKALGCSPFTGPASEAGAARVANSSNSTDSS